MAKSRKSSDLPESKWPIRKGAAVWFLESANGAMRDMTAYAGERLSAGVMHFYNPATVGSVLVTEGRPLCTVRHGGDNDDGVAANSLTNVFDARDVAPKTEDGRTRLLRRAATLAYDQLLSQHTAFSAEITKRLLAIAGTLELLGVLDLNSSGDEACPSKTTRRRAASSSTRTSKTRPTRRGDRC